MKITLEELAERIKKKPGTLRQWRYKYRNTDHPKALFNTEALQECPHSPVYYDEDLEHKYWQSLREYSASRK